MNIFQNCLIDLLEANGLPVLYMDNYIPGRNIYYFGGNGGATLVLTESCMSESAVLEHLKDFGVVDPIEQLQLIEPSCACF